MTPEGGRAPHLDRGLTGLSIGPDFQKGLKDGTILCTLMNKLQPGSIPKINRSMQNWHQLENLSNFIKAMVSYGMNPVDLFEANDLFESGNMTQVQVSLLALAGRPRLRGCRVGWTSASSTRRSRSGISMTPP